MSDTNPDTENLLTADDCTRAAPEEWERVWFERVAPQRDRVRSLRVYCQHGQSARYPAISTDELTYHPTEPPRWEIPGVTVPLTAPQLLALAVQVALMRASEYQTAAGHPPKDVVVRLVVDDANGTTIARVKRRYAIEANSDEATEEEPPALSPDYGGTTAMIPALPMIEKLFTMIEQLIGAVGQKGQPLLGGNAGGVSPEVVRLLVEQASASARADAMAQLLRGGYGHRDDDDEPELADVSPAKRLLIEQLPGVASEFADIGRYGVGKLVDNFSSTMGWAPPTDKAGG